VARVQLLLIRHALPLRSAPDEGADPELSEVGFEQARRLPNALDRHPITRVLSSPQRRAIQTAAPVADALGLDVQIDDRLAEYDNELAHYVPIEQIRIEFPDEWDRLAAGHLPSGVDEDAFIERVFAAMLRGRGFDPELVAAAIVGALAEALVGPLARHDADPTALVAGLQSFVLSAVREPSRVA